MFQCNAKRKEQPLALKTPPRHPRTYIPTPFLLPQVSQHVSLSQGGTAYPKFSAIVVQLFDRAALSRQTFSPTLFSPTELEPKLFTKIHRASSNLATGSSEHIGSRPLVLKCTAPAQREFQAVTP